MKANDVRIGQALRASRGSMSQTELAKRMRDHGHKWTQQTVVAVEKGDRSLRLSEAFDVAQILGVPRIEDLGENAASQAMMAAYLQLKAAQDDLVAGAKQFDAARANFAAAVLAAQLENAYFGNAPQIVARTPEDWLTRARQIGYLAEDPTLPVFVDSVASAYSDHVDGEH